MLEWLLSPIDPGVAHNVGPAVAWHGRSMVLAWGILAPLAVIVARYFKILPGQDWPRQLDNKIWWHLHWAGQTLVLGLSVFGLVLVLPLQISQLSLHGILGCSVLVLLALQVALGVFRGSKGGPTALAPDGSLHGDHYDMTRRRKWFETLHKTMGYSVLIVAGVTIIVGLFFANGPKWMLLVLLLWWLGLGACSVVLQRKGMAMGSYQAIWGTDPAHPGNAHSPHRSRHEQTSYPHIRDL